MTESAPTYVGLPLLTTREHELYKDLTQNALGSAVRLEQERIGFGWIDAALRAM